MGTGLTMGPSLFTYSYKSFSISYKIANCRDALILRTKTFHLVIFTFILLFLENILNMCNRA